MTIQETNPGNQQISSSHCVIAVVPCLWQSQWPILPATSPTRSVHSTLDSSAGILALLNRFGGFDSIRFDSIRFDSVGCVVCFMESESYFCQEISSCFSCIIFGG